MIHESARLMKGTAHEDEWYFYNDAVFIQMAHTTAKWIVDTDVDGKNIIQKWLIPQNNINENIAYHVCPAGNSPEFMPLDNSLNYKLHISHQHHCAVNAHNPRKHSLTISRSIARWIEKIFENLMGAPFPCYIIEDVYIVLCVFEIT